jgi:hypothetical protein
MKSQGCIQSINDSLARESYRIEQVGIPDLRHFVYKSKSTLQYTAPRISQPYMEDEDRNRCVCIYVFTLYLCLPAGNGIFTIEIILSVTAMTLKPL